MLREDRWGRPGRIRRRSAAAASIPCTLAEGEKGENDTQSTAETKMDDGKWKRWSDGEANCQSVELRGRGEKKPPGNERRHTSRRWKEML